MMERNLKSERLKRLNDNLSNINSLKLLSSMIVRSLKIYVALIFSMLPILCMAEESVSDLIQIEQDSLVYELNPKTRTAKLVNGRNSKEKVIIPNTIKRKTKRYKVTEIGDRAFESNRKLKSITIGDEVTRIGKLAFYDCGNLDSIQFTDKTKLDTICEKALDECYHLEYMSLPKDFYSIAYNDMDIMQRFLEINYNILTQKKYPNWVDVNHETITSDDDENPMGLEVFEMKGYRDKYIYMYLSKDVSMYETYVISDSLHIQFTGDGDHIVYYYDYGGDWIGQLNDTTGLIKLGCQFSGRAMDHVWEREDVVFFAVSPHKIQIITELDYYSNHCYEEDEDGNGTSEDEDGNIHCETDYFSYSISNRETNGFYEIDMLMKRGDEDEKHKSTIYYDGKKFVERENKTSE
ncbi:MAG: leucine-rich repeat protein [Paludibacteraceae bacterium]|nr:leucine-rich repeat protein [Paludibacteraceae bacterium]